MFKILAEQLIPALDADPDLAGKVQILWFNVPQPWHPQSGILHEASFAVKNLDASKFNEFSLKLFNAQSQFVDKVTFEKSRKEIIEELALIGAECGVDQDAMALLMMPVCNTPGFAGEEVNTGSGVFSDVKWYVKHHRKRGMHVTPTVILNGLEDEAISSGWTKEQWLDHLGKILAPPQ